MKTFCINVMPELEKQHKLLSKACEALIESNGQIAGQTELYPAEMSIKLFYQSRRISTYRLNVQQRLFYTTYTHRDGNFFVVLLGIDEEHRPNSHSVIHANAHRVKLAKKIEEQILATYSPSSYKSQTEQLIVNSINRRFVPSEKRLIAAPLHKQLQTPMDYLHEAKKYLWVADPILRSAGERILFSKYIWGTLERARLAEEYMDSLPIQKVDFVSIFLDYENFEELADGIFNKKYYQEKNQPLDIDSIDLTTSDTSTLRQISASIKKETKHVHLITEISRKILLKAEEGLTAFKEQDSKAIDSVSADDIDTAAPKNQGPW